jgi:putative copper export protein
MLPNADRPEALIGRQSRAACDNPPMNFGDIEGSRWLILIAGWAHAVAATAWVGGSIFFALVLRPVLAADSDLAARISSQVGSIYRELIDASVIVLVVSGIALMFDRLTGNDASAVYFAVLAVKVGIGLWMFYAVWRLRKTGWRPGPGNGLSSRISSLLGYNAVMAGGIIVFLLAGLLRQLYESAIAR